MFDKLMKDRYGGDQLTLVLLLASVILTLVGRLTKISVLGLLSYLPLGYAAYRMLSKDIEKRRLENYKFSIFVSPIYGKYKGIQNKFKERKTYKYFKCPACNSELKVPKGKGKIKITCPKCGDKFEGRT